MRPQSTYLLNHPGLAESPRRYLKTLSVTAHLTYEHLRQKRRENPEDLMPQLHDLWLAGVSHSISCKHATLYRLETP